MSTVQKSITRSVRLSTGLSVLILPEWLDNFDGITVGWADL